MVIELRFQYSPSFVVEKVHMCCLGMPSHEHKMSQTSTGSAKDAGSSLYFHFEI